MRKTTALCASLALMLVGAGCGGGGDNSSSGSTSTPTTAASTPATTTTPTATTTTPTETTTTPTETTSTGSSSTLTPGAEAVKILSCLLQKKVQKVKVSKGKAGPNIFGTLPSGNRIGFVVFGPSGGAKSYASSFRKSYPQDDVYTSPNDQIVIIFLRKANSSDFDIGNTCQKAAYNG